MEKEQYSRRKFMNRCFSACGMFLGSAVMFTACNSEQSAGEEKKPAASSANPCEDLSGLSADEIDKRNKLGYVAKTQMPGSFCGNCSLYLPKAADQPNQECGGCLLFKGPVYYDGHCIQYASKV